MPSIKTVKSTRNLHSKSQNIQISRRCINKKKYFFTFLSNPSIYLAIYFHIIYILLYFSTSKNIFSESLLFDFPHRNVFSQTTKKIKFQYFPWECFMLCVKIQCWMENLPSLSVWDFPHAEHKTQWFGCRTNCLFGERMLFRIVLRRVEGWGINQTQLFCILMLETIPLLIGLNEIVTPNRGSHWILRFKNQTDTPLFSTGIMGIGILNLQFEKKWVGVMKQQVVWRVESVYLFIPRVSFIQMSTFSDEITFSIPIFVFHAIIILLWIFLFRLFGKIKISTLLLRISFIQIV